MAQALCVLLAAVALFSSTGCKRIEALMRLWHHSPTAAEEAAAQPGVPVVLGQVTRRDVEAWSNWVATIEGSVNAAIRPRVSGYLLTRNYHEGSFLRTGDLMFEIDPRPFEAALDKALANLARSHAEQGKTQLDVERLTPLVVMRAVSQQELDDAVGNNNANLAQIKADEAAVVDARLNLSYTRIISPIDGIAGMANAQIGDLVGPSSPEALTTMSTVDPVTVYFFPTERQYLPAAALIERASHLPVAERPEIFELILADGTTYAQRGRFYFSDRQVDVLTGSIRMAARFANPGNVLRPGQFGRIRTITRHLPDAIVVPQQAISDVQGSFQVAVVKSDHTAEIREVTLGPRDGSDRVILSGLEGNETIVVEGIQRVRDGMKVAAQTPASATDEAKGAGH